MKEFILPVILLSWSWLFANIAPVFSNMSAAQRTDGSYLVDVYYSVQDAESTLLTVSLMVSSDGGTTWNVSCDLLSGDIGTNISPGTNKHIIWNLGTEHPNIVANYHFKVTAEDGYVPPVSGGFVLVPGGTFTMGRTVGTGDANELPTHSVTVSSFIISKYEVTQGNCLTVMGAWNSDPWGGGLNTGEGSNYPVYYVSWYAILKYCNLLSMAEGFTPVYTICGSTNPSDWGPVPEWTNSAWDAAICNWTANGYRLPTEAEWEFAAKGGNSTHNYYYSGSNMPRNVAWYYAGTGSITHPVGTKIANELGLFDMSGNVWEFTWDIYGTYSTGAQNNPHGTISGSTRVLRGGAYNTYASDCTVSRRIYCGMYGFSNDIGFRVCRNSP